MKLLIVILFFVFMCKISADCVFSTPQDVSSSLINLPVTCGTPYRIRWVDMIPKGQGVEALFYKMFPTIYIDTLFSGDLNILNQSQYITFNCSLGSQTIYQIILSELPNSPTSYTCKTKTFRFSTCGNGILDSQFGEECDILLEPNCILPTCTCKLGTYNIPNYGMCCGDVCNVTGDVIFNKGVNLSGRKLTVVGGFSLIDDPIIMDSKSDVVVECLNLANSQLIFNASTIFGNTSVSPIKFSGCTPDITKINITGLNNCTLYKASYISQNDGSTRLQLIFFSDTTCDTYIISDIKKWGGIIAGIVVILIVVIVVILTTIKPIREKVFPKRHKSKTEKDEIEAYYEEEMK